LDQEKSGNPAAWNIFLLAPLGAARVDFPFNRSPGLPDRIFSNPKLGKLGKFLACLATRVTRLGEISPFGRLFTLGSALKITEVAHNFWLLFSTVPTLYQYWQNMGWAQGDRMSLPKNSPKM
jgi:hypothetical protein